MNERVFSLLHIADKNQILFCNEPRVAYIFYRDFKLNLLTGEKRPSSYSEIFEILDQYKVNQEYEKPIVIHLFYEFGFSCVDFYEKLPAHKPLAIIIKYGSFNILDNTAPVDEQEFELDITEYPTFDEYHKKFERVYQNLIDGNCYQVNLTVPFYFKFKGIEGPFNFVRKIWNKTLAVGAYAHATYIDSLGKLYLSNSPECLFEIKNENKKYYAYSMPIKGTMRIEHESDRQKRWKDLMASQKDQGELYMITDLLKNDLTKICLKPAEVLDKKIPLYVPGLVHQYSKIRAEVDESTTIAQIVKAIFPGGSITGAPKKRVMRLIEEIESYDRGFYCGSTVVLFKKLVAASINIRSAEIDYTQNEIFYGAGGGITLLSQPREEFDESYAKMESFLHFLLVRNVSKG